MGFIHVARTKTGLKYGSIYEGLPLGDGILARDYFFINLKVKPIFFPFLFKYLFIWLHQVFVWHAACEFLVAACGSSSLRIGPGAPALRAWSPSHRITKEVPWLVVFFPFLCFSIIFQNF